MGAEDLQNLFMGMMASGDRWMILQKIDHSGVGGRYLLCGIGLLLGRVLCSDMAKEVVKGIRMSCSSSGSG